MYLIAVCITRWYRLLSSQYSRLPSAVSSFITVSMKLFVKARVAYRSTCRISFLFQLVGYKYAGKNGWPARKHDLKRLHNENARRRHLSMVTYKRCITEKFKIILSIHSTANYAVFTIFQLLKLASFFFSVNSGSCLSVLLK
jgi:hypothetical protein